MARHWRRLLFLFRKRRLERDLEDEMRFHLEMTEAKHRAAGMAEDEARYAAARSLGNLTLERERSREFWGWAWFDRLGQDLRYGARALRANPGFTAVAVLTLALGIGANTAIFTLVNAVILRQLPVRNPQELVRMQVDNPKLDFTNTVFSYPLYKDIRDGNEVLAGLVARWPIPVSLSGGGAGEFVPGELVSGNYFGVLGVEPALGRLLTPDDDRIPGGHPVCVLSYALWQRRFGADRDIVGKTVSLNAHQFTVVGVTGATFTGSEPGRAVDVRAPMMMQRTIDPSGSDMLSERRSHWVQIIGRVKPGLSPEQARAGLQVTIDRISASEMGKYDAGRVTLSSAGQGYGRLRMRLEKPLLVLLGITGLVLLIACANLATLLLARAEARRREIAVRLALGAGRGRIVRQLLTESGLLAVLGGFGGLFVGRAVVSVMALFASAIHFGHLDLDIAMDGRIFLFLAAAIAGGTVLFGLAPALEATRFEVVPALKNLSGKERGGLRLREALIAGQIAVCVLLLTGAALFAATLRNLRCVDPGFRPEQIILVTVNPRLNGYTDTAAQTFYERALDHVRSAPGVRAASLAGIVSLSGSMESRDFTPEGYQPRRGEDMSVYLNSVGPGYFSLVRTPLLLGREFSDRDRSGAPRVIVVNDAFARRFWPGQNPVGKRMSWGDPFDPAHSLEVVGVVVNQKYDDLREATRIIAYTPAAQSSPIEMTLHVRIEGDAAAAIAAVKAEIGKLDRNLPIADIKTMSAQVDEALAGERMMATLSGAFAALALLLAAVGLYGVMAYSVNRRKREIGIRIALGAGSGDVVGMVLRRSALLVGIGLAAGLPIAWMSSKVIAVFLYGLSPRDPATYVAVTAVIGAVALFAAYLPARRAARVEPAITLRCD